jgi:hypothetical protein
MIGEMTYCLVVRILTIQFKDIFIEHFSFHRFGVATHGGCETMVHDI